MKTTNEEAEVLFKFLLDEFGYDFQDYQLTSAIRRIDDLKQKLACSTVNDIICRLKDDRTCFGRVLDGLTINTSELFRGPEVFLFLKENVLPILATYPRLKIWHAGCSTGEEVFSFAILLHEAKLLDRSLIYATDINPSVLDQARTGVITMREPIKSNENYLNAGGETSLSNYFTIEYGMAKIHSDLMKNIVFSDHNLVSDHSFAQAEIIFCRNVLIYFNTFLRDRALMIIANSLNHKGFLCLGQTESLRFTIGEDLMDDFSKKHKIYRLKS